MSEVEEKPIIWTGWLKRGEEQGTVVGQLVDTWGWPIDIVGTLDKENGGYRLSGTTGKVPENLRVPIIDDPVTKNG